MIWQMHFSPLSEHPCPTVADGLTVWLQIKGIPHQIKADTQPRTNPVWHEFEFVKKKKNIKKKQSKTNKNPALHNMN